MNITDSGELLELYGEPSYRARMKTISTLDKHCRHFISLSPFLVISTASADGRGDVSPKGDAPGFVAVLDDNTLLIPDRRGNNRLDGIRNILENHHVGLLFLIPGVNETLRINGTAIITKDPALLEPLAVNGKLPTTGIRVHVEEAFIHCAKALIRSKFWNPEVQIERSEFPKMGQILADQIGGLDAEETDRQIEENNRTRLY